AERQPHAEQDADRGENAVPCKRDRTDMNIWIERDLNHGKKRHEAPRVAPASGLCASRGSPGPATRMSEANEQDAGEGAASTRPRAASPSGAPTPWDRTRGARLICRGTS